MYIVHQHQHYDHYDLLCKISFYKIKAIDFGLDFINDLDIVFYFQIQLVLYVLFGVFIVWQQHHRHLK